MTDFRGVSVLITGGAGFASSRPPQAGRESHRLSLSVIGAVGTAFPSVPLIGAAAIGATRA